MFDVCLVIRNTNTRTRSNVGRPYLFGRQSGPVRMSGRLLKLIAAPRRIHPTRRWFAAVLLAASGCTAIGPDRLTDSHVGYNDAVQLTISREVLKNIVRKRYADPMQFINVSTINAQFSVNAGANLGIGGIGTAGPAGSTGANIGYSETPTITFVPQSDAGFNKSIDAPIELQEAMVFLNIVSRFRPDEIGFVIAAVNDAPDRPGQVGQAYRRRIEALARLFERGASLQHFREFYPRHAPIPASRVDGRAYVDAAKADLYFYDAGGGRLNLASKHLGVGLVIPADATPELSDDLRTLSLQPDKRLYPMRSPAEAEPEPFGLAPDTIWLAPRSVEGMMELAAQGVEAPDNHLNAGILPQDSTGESVNVVVPIRIRSSAAEPAARYRIQHRGAWFYIDETDTDSRLLFSTIVEAYAGRIGSKSASDTAPQIVLPIGGG